MEKIRLFANVERVISHSDEVEAILGDAAFGVTGRARSNLAKHRKTGEHRITQTKGNVDHFVNLEGPAALSVEDGHFVGGQFQGDEPKFVEGLHILRDAIEES